MVRESKIFAFIKAIEKPYFNNFINEGQICMNTAKWFRDYETQDNNIGDAGEGAITSCGIDFKISFADPIYDYSSEEELKEKLDQVNWSEPISGEKFRIFTKDDANILSLYAIVLENSNINEYQHVVPRKFIDEFSNHRFILIYNPIEFIKRILKVLASRNKFVKNGIVKYYPLDDKIRENLTFFHKQDYYSYQNEYRLIVQEYNPEQLIFNIGSLNDICTEINPQKGNYKIKLDNISIEINLE